MINWMFVLAMAMRSGTGAVPYDLDIDSGVFGQSQSIEYTAVLAGALLRDPYRIAQTVVTSGVEHAVYVRPLTMQFPETACEVVHNSMKKPLSRMMGNIAGVEINSREPVIIQGDGTRIHVVDLTNSTAAPLDPELCAVLSNVWTKALSAATVPHQGPDQLITNHGYRYHFGTMERGTGYITATLKGVETMGPPASMIAISKLLMDLADAPTDARTTIRDQVLHAARSALLQMR
jgi:hypothetical protein